MARPLLAACAAAGATGIALDVARAIAPVSAGAAAAGDAYGATRECWAHAVASVGAGDVAAARAVLGAAAAAGACGGPLSVAAAHVAAGAGAVEVAARAARDVSESGCCAVERARAAGAAALAHIANGWPGEAVWAAACAFEDSVAAGPGPVVLHAGEKAASVAAAADVLDALCAACSGAAAACGASFTSATALLALYARQLSLLASREASDGGLLCHEHAPLAHGHYCGPAAALVLRELSMSGQHALARSLWLALASCGQHLRDADSRVASAAVCACAAAGGSSKRVAELVKTLAVRRARVGSCGTRMGARARARVQITANVWAASIAAFGVCDDPLSVAAAIHACTDNGYASRHSIVRFGLR